MWPWEYGRCSSEDGEREIVNEWRKEGRKECVEMRERERVCVKFNIRSGI